MSDAIRAQSLDERISDAMSPIADAVTGDDPHAVLAVAESGEDHAVSE